MDVGPRQISMSEARRLRRTLSAVPFQNGRKSRRRMPTTPARSGYRQRPSLVRSFLKEEGTTIATSFLPELGGRIVLRVAAAYAAVAWLLIQVAQTIFTAFGFGETALRVVILVLAIGFLPVLVFAWAFEWTPEGLK